jgi:glycosyltransferase involved in cell wall biosynthesis
MNVLHLNRFYYSSQTAQVFTLIRDQQEQGINARLIMDGNPSYKVLSLYKDILNDLQITMIKPGDMNALLRQAREQSAQLVHAHSSLTYPLASSLATQLAIPLVLTCHGLGLNRQVYRPYLQQAGAIICTSHRVAGSLREFRRKLSIVPSGVNLAEYKSGDKGEPIKIVLIAPPGSGKQKGYNQFCKAVDLLEGVEFYVVGNKGISSKSAKHFDELDKLASLLEKTDITAATGRSAIEALATGNAVIVLGRTYQGILTPEKKAQEKHIDLSGLTGATYCYRNMFYDLAKLTQNNIYLRQLQQFSREVAEHEFDNKALTQRIINVYSQLVK